ncbi:MAG TPA: acyltransferase family protein [Candidatus Blautia merdigallinarum]|uniref:Acyltransferase family protein n=1 Tax=Candidatus Blautia merdigallinarum TaxID=2838495 RepID=A0A9D2SJY5_9FIRM|nr:acyltransferase family protein [Candidatus Blautia merdigallinarum]
MSTKSRNYFLDNYKSFLILLVVIGHFIEPCYTNNLFLTILKWVIFSFHMPAFIFISGYFSKKDMGLEKLIQKLVIPYFIFELLYYFLYVFVIHKETGLYFNRPKFSLWYLMSLFFWRIATPYLKRIPGNLFIAITGGLLIGFTQLGNFFSIPRTLFFYPFFLAGYYFQENWFDTVRRHWKAFTIGLAAAPGLLGGWVLFTGQELTPFIFYGRYSYADMGLTNGVGLLVRLVCYGISFLAIFAVCAIIPRKKHFYSILGVRTMSIYLFHGLVYSILKDGHVLEKVNTPLETVLLLGFCILLTFVLASSLPYRFVAWISSFPIRLPKSPFKSKKTAV